MKNSINLDFWTFGRCLLKIIFHYVYMIFFFFIGGVRGKKIKNYELRIKNCIEYFKMNFIIKILHRHREIFHYML